MHKKTKWILWILVIVLLAGGFGMIAYNGMPVRELEEQTIASDSGEGKEKAELIYSMEEVATHNAEADCWSAINGQVYDLSSWVSRHPGGAKPILGLCGTDGSERFNKKHGQSSKPQAALALLKIGTLIQ